MLNAQAHKTILIQILKEIYSNTNLGPLLGFKGGTAVYLFHDLPRFSVDLDFDLLNQEKEEFVFEEIKNILQNFGKLIEASIKRFTLFFVISYEKGQHKIKVEISRRKFGSVYEIKNYLGISILTMQKSDIFAHKLVALTDRKKPANRDVFDIWFFFKNNWLINESLVELRTKMNFKNYLKKCIRFIQDVNDTHILQGIGELIDEKTKIWVKQNLKKEVIFLLKLKIETIS